MPKPPRGKYPSLQLRIHCHTCDEKIRVSVNYSELRIWNNTGADALSRWARHEGHDVEVQYDFFDGRERRATQ